MLVDPPWLKPPGCYEVLVEIEGCYHAIAYLAHEHEAISLAASLWAPVKVLMTDTDKIVFNRGLRKT